MKELKVIGKSIPRVDAREKVTGSALYCHDIKLPGMLLGKIKRSPYPFAKIISIDATKARRLSGVKAVITAQDVTQFHYGIAVFDELPLADDYVRYVGDEVAAVAAVDEETAEEALDLIAVEYQELTPVLDTESAIKPGAPAIHPELQSIKQNTPYHIDYERGDCEAAFKEADLVIEERFFSQRCHHTYLETQSCISDWSVPDKLTIRGSSQTPFPYRAFLARALGIPEGRIRMIQPYVGGGFGGKCAVPQPLYFISALLSKKAGKPVKIVLSREEDFIAGRPRLMEKIDLRMGFKKDGTILAKDVAVTGDCGAYVGIGSVILSVTASRTGSLYRFTNIKMEANLVYTNKIPVGAFRGFGDPQMHFALESMLDMAAEKLEIDPMDIRLKNATQKGDISVHGWVINSCGLSDSIKLAAEKSDWKRKRAKARNKYGLGMACQIHVSGTRTSHPFYDGSAAIIHMDQFGRAKVISGEGEIGQGASTIFSQITAEELSIPLEDIEVLPVDTDVSPFCQGPFASRVTVLGGNAVQMAAKDVAKQVLKYAAEKLGTRPDDMEIQNGKVYARGDPKKVITIAEVAHYAVFKRGGAPIIGNGTYTVPDSVVTQDRKTLYGNISIAYPFSTQVAEVLVDPETGNVDVLNIWVAEDIGRTLNPMAAEGQIEGGVVQGIGYALSEDYFFNEGRIGNPNFSDYKIPISLGVPAIHSIFIETNNPGSPYGAKGVGESAMIPTAVAIANAVYNAIGVRIKDLPITPEKILMALEDKEKTR